MLLFTTRQHKAGKMRRKKRVASHVVPERCPASPVGTFVPNLRHRPPWRGPRPSASAGTSLLSVVLRCLVPGERERSWRRRWRRRGPAGRRKPAGWKPSRPARRSSSCGSRRRSGRGASARRRSACRSRWGPDGQGAPDGQGDAGGRPKRRAPQAEPARWQEASAGWSFSERRGRSGS